MATPLADPPAHEIKAFAALFAAGQNEQAEKIAKTLAACFPFSGVAWKMLGVVLAATGRDAEALTFLQKAAELLPDDAEAHSNLGLNLKSIGRLSEAEASCRRAIQLRPDFAQAHNVLGVTLQELGRLREAEASFHRAIYIEPDFAKAHSNLIFTLDLIEGCTIEQQQGERRSWYEQHGRRYAASMRRHENAPDPDRRLRVGFVSADLRQHSAYYTFSPVILRLNRNAFDVICYSEVKVEDETTARLRGVTEEWRSTVGISDDEVAEQIRRDRIDILVDLSGHSAGNRLLVFARKPAPVQVTAWGYATGTGLATMDYFLADAVLVPQQERSLYAEEVVDLPCVITYEPPDYLPEVSSLPALGGKVFTFGCINRIAKISDRVMGLWGRILAELPEAQLLLKDRVGNDPAVWQRLLERLGAAGIAPERVRILGPTPHSEHLKIYHEVDLGLDPYPHGGGVSTAEALWLGVPVVSMQGTTIPSRLSASIMIALGMSEWVAHSDQEYVRIAVKAARDLPRLARVRSGLRSRMAASAFGNPQLYTREVEAVFRTLWKRWCAGKPKHQL